MTASSAHHDRSANEVERVLALVWGDVLDVPEVATDDNFFDLGGNSLKGMQVVGRLSQALGIEVPLVTLFEAQTLGAFADAVEGLLVADIVAGEEHVS